MKVGPIQLALYLLVVGLVLLYVGWLAAGRLFHGVRFSRLEDAEGRLTAGDSGLDVQSARWGGGEILCLFGFHYFAIAICAYFLLWLVNTLQARWLQAAYPQSAELLVALSNAGSLPSSAPSSIAVLLYSQVLAAALTVVVSCYVITTLGRSPMSSVGLQRVPLRRDLARLALLFAGFFVVCQIVRILWASVLDLLGHEVSQQAPLNFYFDAIERVDPLWISLLVINAVCIAPVVEEFLFRGVLHGFLSRKLGFYWAALLSSFAFAAVHITPSVLLPIFVLGLLLSAIYERRGSLYENIFFHALFNAVTLVIGWLIVTYGPAEWLKNA